MEKNYQTVTSGEISKVFNFSQAYIGQFYKQYTGKTLTQTIQSIRLRHAVELLLETRIKVDEICEMVGYMDVTSFIRLFKQTYGQTPYQYRLNNDSSL